MQVTDHKTPHDTLPQPLVIFTAAEVQGRTLFRAARVDLHISPGAGRIWLDVSRGQGFTSVWQQALQHLNAVGRRHFPSSRWDETDLFFSARGKNLTLDGRSASLPLFIAWLSLLFHRPLPGLFLASGVALDSELLLAAPAAFIQGKLEVAAQLARQLQPRGPFPVPFFYPTGSEVDFDAAPDLALTPVSSLVEGATLILGLHPSPMTGLPSTDDRPRLQHPVQQEGSNR